MAIKKKQSSGTSNDDTQHGEENAELRAGVSEQEETDAKEDADEHKNDEAPPGAELDDDDDDDDGLKAPPEGVVVANELAVLAEGTPPAAFTDEFVGIGGSYAVDPETGERKPVYEKFLNAKGKERYRTVK